MNYPIIGKQFPLILASASPRRKQLLAQLGLPFRSVKSHVSEKDLYGDPLSVSCRLAERKAFQVQLKNGDFWILGADTVVAIGDMILGKPEDEIEARRMLCLLSGKEHKVITAICILNPSGQRILREAVETTVRFIELSDQEIRAYIKTGEPYGKAGGYAIQGIGAFMVYSISGSYSNVVGLPLCNLVKGLLTVGAIQHFPLPR